MAKKTSELPVAQVGSEADLYAVVQSAQSRKQTRTQMRAAMVSGWQAFIGTFLGSANVAAARTAIGAISSSDSITGSAATLTTSRSISATGDASWTVNFDGSANATSALTLAASGVGAGTYGQVTVDTKGRVTAAAVATSTANGGTGATSATAAGTNLGTATVGTNTDQLARSSMIQAEIANKRAWTSYSPSIEASTGTYTSASATGSHMVAFGICYWRATITITTRGTGTFPRIGLPFPSLAGMAGVPILARTINVNFKSGAAVIEAGLTTALVSAADTTDLGSADGAIIHINGCYPVA